MQSDAKTVEAYLKSLPAERREVISAVRNVILQNLDKGFEEGMQYGMIGYYVPHRLYPAGYHCNPKEPLPYMSLAAQKNNYAVYSMAVYGNPKLLAWFTKAWKDTGKKLDMGKSCIRFTKLENIPLEIIGELVKRTTAAEYIACIDASLSSRTGTKKASAKSAKKKSAPAKKKVVKKTSRS